MASVNSVFLIGGIGKDPEVREFQSGDKVVSLSVATTEKWKDRDGNKQERVDWHNVSVFGHAVDFVTKYIAKGTQVAVQGKLRTDKHNDKYYTKVIVDRGGSIQVLSGWKESDNSGYDVQGDPQYTGSTKPRQVNDESYDDFGDESIPF